MTSGRLTHAGLTEEALESWGRAIGAQVPPPLILALSGPLGAGKSVLARAVARGAGVTGPVPSPTFNILFRYPRPAGGEVVHLDLYRLGAPDELWELGWEELGDAHELVLVEWPERAGPHLPEPRWDIDLRPVAEQRALRSLRATPVGGAPALPPLPAAGAGREVGP